MQILSHNGHGNLTKLMIEFIGLLNFEIKNRDQTNLVRFR